MASQGLISLLGLSHLYAAGGCDLSDCYVDADVTCASSENLYARWVGPLR